MGSLVPASRLLAVAVVAPCQGRHPAAQAGFSPLTGEGSRLHCYKQLYAMQLQHNYACESSVQTGEGLGMITKEPVPKLVHVLLQPVSDYECKSSKP